MAKKIITPDVDIQALVDGYFAECEASKDVRELKNGDIKVRQQMPTMIGLANYLGISKETLYKYLNGGYSNIDSDNVDERVREYTITVADVLTRARGRIEAAILQAAASGDIDSKIASIMLGKFGYSSKVETESKGSVTVKWEGVSGSDADAWGS